MRPVSYTHLDVYKRQAVFTAVWQLHRAQARAFVKLDGLDPETFYEVKKPDGTLLGHFMGDVLMHAGIRLAPIEMCIRDRFHTAYPES